VLTLAVGVVDTVYLLGVSTLNISNLQASPVPETGELAQPLARIGLLGATVKRRAARVVC
jgi:hypothetical protein